MPQPLVVVAVERPPDFERLYGLALLARREQANGPRTGPRSTYLRGRFEGLAIGYSVAVGLEPGQLDRAPAIFDDLWAEHEIAARLIAAGVARRERWQ